MTRRRWAVVVIALAVVIVVVIAVRGSGGSSDDPAAGASATPTATTSATASPSQASEIAPVTTQTVAPGSPTPTGLPGVDDSAAPAVPAPVPSAVSQQGALVAGYPKRLVPVVKGSVVRSSSVSPSKGRLQVALDAEVRADPDDVLRFYAVRLARLGFVSSQAPAVGGSVAASYKRGRDSVVVTVVTTGGPAHDYTAFATLVTKKS